MARLTMLLERLERLLAALVSAVGRAVGWLLLVLMAVVIFDVVTRRFFVLGSSRLQELEWHLHAVVFALALGYVLVQDGHVRIELVRDRLSGTTRAWIEILGTLLLLFPFALVTLFYGIEFAATSFAQGESSPSPQGLPHRWIVKSSIPIGMLLLFLAGIVVLIRNVLLLLRSGKAALPDVTETRDVR